MLAEQVIDAVPLAPGHQTLAGEAGIRAQKNARVRSALPDMGDDPVHFVLGAGGAVDVGTPQLGRQQLAPREDIERQVAVAVVIAVEEPPFLMTVDGIVSRGRGERLMHRHGIWAMTQRRFRVVTTDSYHSLPVADNLLDQTFLAIQPNEMQPVVTANDPTPPSCPTIGDHLSPINEPEWKLLG